jgi:hypothetical protein
MSTLCYRVEVTAESKKAICVSLDGDGIKHWIPRSQIQPGSQVHHAGERGVLGITTWFAKTAHLPQPQGAPSHGI